MNIFNSMEEMSMFDSSLSELIDKSLTHEEYKSYIIDQLKPILENVFREVYQKQKINPHKDRITFACPYCKDSMQSLYKKRGNIILLGKHQNHFKCFNCGTFRNVTDFFKDFKVEMKLDAINYISNNINDFSQHSASDYNISMLLDVDNIEKYAIERELLKSKFGLIEIKDSTISTWLKNRMQYKFQNFLFSPSKKYILILNLTSTGKIIGSQKRVFSGPNKYLTFNAQKLHELLELEQVPDDINMISQLFGILQLNFNKPVTIFEGPLDSFLYNNSIANTGANKSFPLSLPVRYWFDFDKTGREKSIQLLKDGNEVFLWSKLLQDYQMPFRKKWDLNDAQLWFKQNNIKVTSFEKYFSNNQFDIMDI